MFHQPDFDTFVATTKFAKIILFGMPTGCRFGIFKISLIKVVLKEALTRRQNRDYVMSELHQQETLENAPQAIVVLYVDDVSRWSRASSVFVCGVSC
jgi:hypothetical protein